MDQADKFTQMTTEPIPSLIVKLAVPTIISMLISSFYNAADTYFVSKIDTSATAAVGVTFAFMAIIQACGFFFGHGSGNYISRKLGAQDYGSANVMAATGFFLSIFAGCFITITGLIFLEPLARLLGSTPTILPYAKSYLGIILLGAPVMMSSLVLNNQLRFQGSAAYGMVGIVTGGLLNVFLDPLLIFVFDLGIAGAAIATIFSQFVSFCILLVMCHKGGNIIISWKNFRPSRKLINEILAGGSPSIFRQGLGAAGTIMLNVAAGVYGDAAIAAMSIVTRLMFFAASVMIGLGQGYQPVCGFSYGAKLYGRLREAFKFCLQLAVIFALAVAVLGYWQAEWVVRLFRDDQVVIEIGIRALRYQALAFPLTGLIILTNMTLQTTRHTKGAIVVAAARQGVFLIPLLLVLPQFWGLNGVVWSQPCSDILSFILSFILIRLFFKRLPQ